jgi:hypothetical protein
MGMGQIAAALRASAAITHVTHLITRRAEGRDYCCFATYSTFAAMRSTPTKSGISSRDLRPEGQSENQAICGGIAQAGTWH